MAAHPQLATIDQNLQTIRSIEGAWGLPGLPDEVKFDLALYQQDPAGVASFLYGIGNDIQAAQRRPALPAPSPLDVGGAQPPWQQEAARTAYGLMSARAPQIFDPLSVQNWKQRASDQGYLDLTPQEIQDPRWLPEYNSIGYEMNLDQMAREFQGDRPGSSSISNILREVGEWITPSNLYRQAINFDLWWDFGAVGREAADWSNKWDRVVANPTSPRAWIDALTGPIDDVVLPIVNWVSMFVGVGEVVALGRGLQWGAKAAKFTPSALRALVPGRTLKNIFTAADPALDIARMRAPGQGIPGLFLGTPGRNPIPGTVFGRALNTVRSTAPVEGLARGLDRWRATNASVMARKINQTIMRQGFLAKAEDWALPNRPGNIPITSPDLTEWYDRTITDNPGAALAVDLLSTHFLPATFFQQGAVGEIAQVVRRGATKVWYAGTGQARLFQRLGESEEAVTGLHRAYRRVLEEVGGPAAVEALDRDAARVGLNQAVANRLTNGSIEELGELHFWMSVNAGIEALTDEVVSAGGRIDRATRTAYQQTRRSIAAKVSQYDTNDPDAVLEHIALYRVMGEDAGQLTDPVRVRSPKKARRSMEALQERYRESEADTLLRNGAVPEGSVRLFRKFDPENGDRWTWVTSTDEINPQYMDLDLVEAAERFNMTPEQLLENLDNPALDLDIFFARNWVLDGGIRRRTVLSDAPTFRRYSPKALERLRTVVRGHNAAGQATLRELLDRTIVKDPSLLEEFYYKTLPTMGSMSDFIKANELIDNAYVLGQLDNVTYRNPLSPSGRRLSGVPWAKGGLADGPWGEEMTNIFYDLADSDDLAQWLSTGMFAPLARDMDPTRGSFTIGRVDPDKVIPGTNIPDPAYNTVFKDEALEFAAQANHRVEVLKALDRLGGKPVAGGPIPRGAEALRRVGEALDTTAIVPRTIVRTVVDSIAQDMALSTGFRTDLRRVVRYALDNKVDLTAVRDTVLADIARLNDSPWWAGRYNISEINRTGNAVESLAAKIKELKNESFFMAARVEGAPEALTEALARQGKVLVHGVDFVMPKDILNNVPELAEVTAAQQRQMAIGNLFRRRAPRELGVARTRQFRSSLWAAIARAERSGGDIRIRLNKFEGADFAGGQGDLGRVENDLRDMLHQAQEAQNYRRELSQQEGIVSRTAQRVVGGQTPHTISDLASPMYSRGRFNVEMRGRGYNSDEIQAVWEAVHQSRALGFKLEGIAAVESYLRSKPLATDGLRLLSRHTAKDNITGVNRAALWVTRNAASSLGGGFAYTEYNDITGQQGLNPGSLAAGITGALAGRAGVHALLRKLDWVENAPARLGALRKLRGKTDPRLPWGAALADKWDSGKWSQYAYIADNLAGWRDYMRFAISPIFDASRYSEAVVLSQLADLPPGIANLSLNQSPSTYRRFLAREQRKLGKTADEARELAKLQWDKNRAEFLAASRGDFDYEAIESLAGWTDQAGILGFSPAEWMVSTFSHLRDSGVQTADAYRISREIYTYGTTGRSAAELSMNFVFFPFSFTKKSLGHVKDFLQQDVGRAILLHDMVKTYEVLNEKYDLNTWFDERMPILQKMQRLNLFAYGVSLGEFGGINAPVLKALGETPPGQIISQRYNPVDPIMSLFAPQMVEIRNAGDAREIQNLIRRILPAVNDITQLTDDAVQQGYVIGSETHLTQAAQSDRAWEEWRDFQKMWTEGLEAAGITWGQAMENPAFQSVVDQARAEIGFKYPTWKEERGDWVGARLTLQMELDERTLNPTQRGGDQQLIDFRRSFDFTTQRMGLDWENPEFIPPFVFTGLRATALQLAQQNPRFLGLYRRFYGKLLGPISTELVNTPQG